MKVLFADVCLLLPMRMVSDSTANSIIANIDIVTAGDDFGRHRLPNAMLLLPVMLLKSALLPLAVLLMPVCVAYERKKTVGRVVVAGGVLIEGMQNRWPCCNCRCVLVGAH